MSDALSFLIKARPEAMGHYFAFLKVAGRHLDPKTRALISVITKVHSQTSRGLRQYVKRAVSAGCSGTEILDALLMAFPALGLAKIVWAVDVLLEMKLPEFDPARMGGGEWRELGLLKDIPRGKVRKIEREGRAVFVFRDAGGCRVYDAHCPHQGTNIPLEALKGGKLVCPKHGWTFDARSGACVAKGDTPLRVLESKIEKEKLLARM
ncbi:MAG: carboxymuconolactone decarboxylase [Betaproteobacteria bacterium RIFCSPLOWO2_02_FULL_66_14]|nr:MAG: carboxymuconolactone decarboxylase [Betaproteobacteria bacterium RIFCSPLOWO2_02_FULL_66_14]